MIAVRVEAVSVRLPLRHSERPYTDLASDLVVSFKHIQLIQRNGVFADLR
jgi:hypothetical protein